MRASLRVCKNRDARGKPQQNSDPATDQLHTTGFALLGLHEAVGATGDAKPRRVKVELMEYRCRTRNCPKQPRCVSGYA